jgi:hypothetical protein
LNLKRTATGGTAAAALLAMVVTAPVRAAVLPAGTALSVRLTTAVSSRASRPGDPVSALLIAPVPMGDGGALPAGWSLRGNVAEVGKEKGRPLLRLNFNELVGEDAEAWPVTARVVAVDDAGERVDGGGRIVGTRSMRRLPSPLAVLLLLAAHAEPVAFAALEAGQLALRTAEHRAIDYPPGVEMTLALVAPLQTGDVPAPRGEATADPRLCALARSMPSRTEASRGRAADATNLLLAGSRVQVEDAFVEAGWTPARPMTLGARLRGLRALVMKECYKPAPVSTLDLDGRPPDLVFEKQNDTLAKRHHVRVWRWPGGSGDAEVWVGAATHDVGITFDRHARGFTHRIDPHVDAEREKIVNDLLLTGDVAAVSLVDRPIESTGEFVAATGPLVTDGRVAVVVLRRIPTDGGAVGGAESGRASRAGGLP